MRNNFTTPSNFSKIKLNKAKTSPNKTGSENIHDKTKDVVDD
jgi:hypothetical protein